MAFSGIAKKLNRVFSGGGRKSGAMPAAMIH